MAIYYDFLLKVESNCINAILLLKEHLSGILNQCSNNTSTKVHSFAISEQSFPPPSVPPLSNLLMPQS